MIAVAISPQLYARGAGGVPDTSLPLPDLRNSLSRYTHTINVTGGFEGCTLEVETSLDEALDWLNNLGASIEVVGPDAQTLWEGFLSDVSIEVGAESISLSLDDCANAVRIRYQPGIGPQVSSAFVTDTTSIATYGRKELIWSGSGMTAASAAVLASTLLAQRARPLARRSGGTSTGERASSVRLTLGGTGWYYALGWLTTSNATTATAITTTQLQTLVAAYNATNNFYSVDFTDVTGSGVSETQYIDPDTAYRARIEGLLALGNSSGQRLAYGVYEGRRWKVATWTGATPSTITYQRSLGDGQIRDSLGGVVDPWDVRPDAMYQVAELIDPSQPVTSDSPSAFYVERVTCSIDRSGVSVRLEPAKSGELDVLLARIRG